MESKNEKPIKKSLKSLITIQVCLLAACILFIFCSKVLFPTLESFDLIPEKPPIIVAPEKCSTALTKMFEKISIEKTSFKAGEQSKYNSLFGMPANSAWCAAFLSYIGYKSGNSDLIPFAVRCTTQMMYFNNIGELYFADYLKNTKIVSSYQNKLSRDFHLIDKSASNINIKFASPKVGSLVYFNYDSNRFIDHVGYIISVKYNNLGQLSHFYTVEGNSNNKIEIRKYKFNDSSIVAFALPDYEKSNKNNLNYISIQNKKFINANN